MKNIIIISILLILTSCSKNKDYRIINVFLETNDIKLKNLSNEPYYLENSLKHWKEKEFTDLHFSIQRNENYTLDTSLIKNKLSNVKSLFKKVIIKRVRGKKLNKNCHFRVAKQKISMYSTDLTQTQWQFIKKVLDFDDRKRKYDLHIIWNAIMYLVKTGCQWRLLPSGFPIWQLVYYYYSKWSNLEAFDLLLSKLREKVRVKRGQKATASLGIMDSQSVRWGNNRSLNSFDGHKKVKGIKRHVVVDKNGFLLAVMVGSASIHDSKSAVLLMKMLQYLLIPLQGILADGGYRGDIVEEIKAKFGYTIHIVMRSGKKDKKFEPIHKRWIIERTFSWFDNDRRLCRNYELLMETSENMVKLSAIKLLLNKI